MLENVVSEDTLSEEESRILEFRKQTAANEAQMTQTAADAQGKSYTDTKELEAAAKGQEESAAKLRDMLGGRPEKVLAEVSGNILKNVKSVVVPNTGSMKGIKAALSAGIVAGQSDLELQVIGSVSSDRYVEIKTYCEHTPI